MASFGVRCTMGDGEDTVMTVDAQDAAGALAQVHQHQSVFGGHDAPGNWLRSRRPPEKDIVQIHEAKPMGEWTS